MSYLRGPLTKDQIETLVQATPRPEPEAVAPLPAPSAPAADESGVAPTVADGIPVRFLDPAAPWSAQVGAAPGGTRLQAFLAARVSLRFDDAKAGLDHAEEWEALYGPLDDGLDLDAETPVDYEDRDFGTEPPAGAGYVLPQAPIAEASFFREATRRIQQRQVDGQALEIQRNPSLKLYSRPGETPEQFARRCDEAAQVEADRETAKIRDRLEARKDRLEDALATAQRRVEEAETSARSHQTTELLAGAGAVLGALLGGRRSTRSIAGSVGSAASRRGVSARAAERKRTAEAKVEQKTDELADLEQELLDEVTEIDARWQERAADIETLSIRPEAADVRVTQLTLLWVPTA
jgi:hypothetical protein